MPQALEIDRPVLPDQPALQLPSGGSVDLDTLVRSIIMRESGGKTNAVGKAGERGLMQIMPQTAAMYGVTPEKLFDPKINREVGKRYLGDLLKKYNGSIVQALAAYNAGPGNVDKGIIPPSTRDYVRKVLEGIGGVASKVMGEGTAYGEEMDPSSVPADVRAAAAKMKGASPELGAADVPPDVRAAAAAMKGGAAQRTGFQKYFADPATELVSRGIGGIMAGPGGMEKPSVFEKSAAEFIVPQTPTQAGIAAASLAIPAIKGAEFLGPAARVGESILGRIGLTGLGGAVGAGLGGEDIKRGALTGAAGGTLGELGGAALGRVGRKLGGPALEREMASGVGETIGKRFPEMPAMKSAAEIEQVLTRGEGVTKVQRVLSVVKDKVRSQMRGKLFAVPDLEGNIVRVPFDEADELIAKMNARGYSPIGDIRTGISSGEYRQLAYGARQRLAKQLNNLNPQLGAEYLSARRNLSAAKTLQKIFSDSKAFLPNGQLNQARIADLVGRKYYESLARDMGEPRTLQLIAQLRRFGEGPVKDVAGQPGRFYVSGLPIPHAGYHPGHGASLAGQLPQYMAPGGRPLGSALTYELSKLIDEAVGGENAQP